MNWMDQPPPPLKSWDLTVYVLDRVSPDELRAHRSTATYAGNFADTVCGGPRRHFEIHAWSARGLKSIAHAQPERVIRCASCFPRPNDTPEGEST